MSNFALQSISCRYTPQAILQVACAQKHEEQRLPFATYDQKTKARKKKEKKALKFAIDTLSSLTQEDDSDTRGEKNQFYFKKKSKRLPPKPYLYSLFSY